MGGGYHARRLAVLLVALVAIGAPGLAGPRPARVQAGFETVDERLEQAARTLGRTEASTFFTIILSRPTGCTRRTLALVAVDVVVAVLLGVGRWARACRRRGGRPSRP